MPAVLEIGPHNVRVLSGGTGSCPPRATVEAALDWIDDAVGLLDELPVRVADLWRTVMVTVLGSSCESVVVIHPDEWTQFRIDRVRAAANAVADQVEAVPRSEWTQRESEGMARGVAAGADPAPDRARPPRHLRPRTAPVFGTAAVILVAGALTVLVGRPAESGLRMESDARGAADARTTPDSRTVTEGRVAVRIPGRWSVARVTDGAGSPRIQADAPDDSGIALHITQTYAPESTLAQAAGVFGRAIAGQPTGVFVEFRPDGEVAGRPAVTYREVRPGRVIAWSVLLDGSTRIAIGCQSPPGRDTAVRAACDEAVRSAREVSGTGVWR